MTTPTDGGPAFPHDERDANGQFRQFFGMSLRDYFAGQALAGLCAQEVLPDIESIGNLAYETASSMLTAKAAQREQP